MDSKCFIELLLLIKRGKKMQVYLKEKKVFLMFNDGNKAENSKSGKDMGTL